MRFGFYDNRDNRNNGLILNSMLSVDNNKNNFYQPEGWLPLETLLMGLLLAVFVCGFGFGFYDNRDNRIFNAFALTARMDNAQLHPG